MDNMINVFEGIVNGHKFDNRDEMNKFIGELITSGQSINELSFSHTTCPTKPGDCLRCGTPASSGRAAIENAQRKKSWVGYVHEINSEVPEPYTNVINYIVPFIKEDITITCYNRPQLLDDLSGKLAERMKFMEYKVFQAIQNNQYDVTQVKAWMDELCTKLKFKAEWSHKRVCEITAFLDSIPETANDIIINHVNTLYLKSMCDLYQETAGFCRALIDICNEKVADLK